MMGSLETISLEYQKKKRIIKTGAGTALTQHINIIYNGNGNGWSSGGS